MKLEQWMYDHRIDYATVLSRVEKTKTLLLSSRYKEAGNLLRYAYIWSVMSIRTGLDRHERAFARWCNGASLSEAAQDTVYGYQKAGWMEETMDSNGWAELASAVRYHHGNSSDETLLDVIVENLKGVSYRKGGFMLASAGLSRFMCIDSHVARYAGLDESEGSALEFADAADYLATCDSLLTETPNPYNFPPFLVQWAIFDWQRGEHRTHMPFYREVLPEVMQ